MSQYIALTGDIMGKLSEERQQEVLEFARTTLKRAAADHIISTSPDSADDINTLVQNERLQSRNELVQELTSRTLKLLSRNFARFGEDSCSYLGMTLDSDTNRRHFAVLQGNVFGEELLHVAMEMFSYSGSNRHYRVKGVDWFIPCAIEDQSEIAYIKERLEDLKI